MKVLTGGKFNDVHAGHLYLLKKAKRLGRLIVVIANDKHNKRKYALSAKKRKAMVKKTHIPDKVIIGDSTDFTKIIDKEKPDIIVLGYDQKLPPRTVKKIKENKIKVVKFGKYKDFSTRKKALIIGKINYKHGK